MSKAILQQEDATAIYLNSQNASGEDTAMELIRSLLHQRLAIKHHKHRHEAKLIKLHINNERTRFISNIDTETTKLGASQGLYRKLYLFTELLSVCVP